MHENKRLEFFCNHVVNVAKEDEVSFIMFNTLTNNPSGFGRVIHDAKFELLWNALFDMIFEILIFAKRNCPENKDLDLYLSTKILEAILNKEAPPLPRAKNNEQ